jgi:hypothetical protein
MGAGVTGDDVELAGEGVAERVADQRVVVDDQEQGLAGQEAAFREIVRRIITTPCEKDGAPSVRIDDPFSEAS